MIKNKFLATLFITSAISTINSFAATPGFDFSTIDTYGKFQSLTEAEYNSLLTTANKRSKQIETWRPTMDAFNDSDFTDADLTVGNKAILDAAAAHGFTDANLTVGNKAILDAAAAHGFTDADLTVGNKAILDAAAAHGFTDADLTVDNKAALDFIRSAGLDFASLTSAQKAQIGAFLTGSIPSLTLSSTRETIYLPKTEIELNEHNEYNIEGTTYSAADFGNIFGIAYDKATGDYFDLSTKTKTTKGNVTFATKWTFNTEHQTITDGTDTYTNDKYSENDDRTFTVIHADGSKKSYSTETGDECAPGEIQAKELHSYLTSFGGKIQREANAAFIDAPADYTAAIEKLQLIALKFGK